MADLVVCHSGSVYAEYPLRFQFKGRLLPVNEILRRWRSPACKCFRVRTATAVFDLYYDEEQDNWQVEQLFSGVPISVPHEESE
jgi:hypothetical protein